MGHLLFARNIPTHRNKGNPLSDELPFQRAGSVLRPLLRAKRVVIGILNKQGQDLYGRLSVGEGRTFTKMNQFHPGDVSKSPFVTGFARKNHVQTFGKTNSVVFPKV